MTMAILALASTLAAPAPSVAASVAAATAPAEGVIRVRSGLAFEATVERIEATVRANGIRFFGEIDQTNLAARAGLHLRPSRLLIFGNPPLGLQFLTSNPLSGLDWPVRMLVTQDEDGSVWVAYTDFAAIGARYAITDRAAALAMATKVSAMIAASTSAK